jgi:hypothetical protein
MVPEILVWGGCPPPTLSLKELFSARISGTINIWIPIRSQTLIQAGSD